MSSASATATLDPASADTVTVLSQPALPVYPHLHDLMRGYQLKDLVNVSAEAFTREIHGYLDTQDHAVEGFADPARQDPLAVQFHWGHTHDFGGFGLEGRMGKHHMSMIAVFVDELRAMPASLEGLRVLDIGCWTGGTSLLMCAMGAEVVAVEEVAKYAACVNYLRWAFDVRKLEVRNLSLFECTTPTFEDAFDIVLCGGVLHHVSDPKLALRILFNCLKDGGTCLLETIATTAESVRAIRSGSSARSDEGGPRASEWNALLFTPDMFAAMLTDVGFAIERPCRMIQHKTPLPRLFSVGRRREHADMCRSGLSVRAIR